MAYPISKQSFVTKINKNASGWAIGPEYFNVPGSAPYEMYFDHIPKSSATTALSASGGAPWTEVFVAPTATTQYQIDYTTGKVTFYSANANAAVGVAYQTLGDDIMAEHINLLQTEMGSVEGELGDRPRGSDSTVSDRLNRMQYEINGKHTGIPIASEVVCTPPGAATFADVQAHINAHGTGTVSDSNPHGISISGSAWSSTSNYETSGTIQGGNIYGNEISASGTHLYVNALGPDRDSYLCYYDNSDKTNKFLRWNNTNSRFELNYDEYVLGSITASGNLMPEASGTRHVGSAGTGWNEGHFKTIWADTGYITNLSGSTSATSVQTLQVLASGTTTYAVLPNATGINTNDDSIPEKTEGDEVCVVPFTPKSASSKIIIIPSINGTANSGSMVTAALFEDDSQYATYSYMGADGSSVGGNYMGIYTMDSWGLTSKDLKLRVGQHNNNYTFSLNGGWGTRCYGGTTWSGLTILECVDASGSTGGAIAAMKMAQDGAGATCTASWNFDDTKPQRSEGTDFPALKLSHACASATNYVILEADIYMSHGIDQYAAAAIFASTQDDCIAVGQHSHGQTGGEVNAVNVRGRFTPGTTNSIDYTIRFSAVDVHSYFDDALMSTFKLTEVTA